MKRVLLVLLVSWMGLAQAPIQRNPWSTNRTGDPVLGNNNLIVTNIGTGLDWMFYGTSTSRVVRIADFPLGLMVGTNATQFRVTMTGDTTGTNYIAGPIVGNASGTNANVLGQVTANNAVVTNTVGIGGSVSPQALLDVGPAADGTNAVRINGGVQTGSSRPALEVSQTLNNPLTAFKTVRIVNTNSASAAGSRPFEVYGGAAGVTRLLDIDNNGSLSTGGYIAAGTVLSAGSGYNITFGPYSAMRSVATGGEWILLDSSSLISRVYVRGPPKTTPMGATTTVVLLGLTSTNFTAGEISYTIADVHAGGAGATNGVQVGSGRLMYTAGALNIGGVTNYIVNLTDSTNAAVNAGANTFGWTWTALTNYIGSPQGFYLQLTPTNTVVDRATTETCTVTYQVVNNAAQLVTPQ